jgi:hypothetical protein
MSERETLRDIEQRLRRLERRFEELLWILNKRLPKLAPPAAGTLFGTFTSGATMSTTVLTATIPTTRQDGSALAATDIASITYQKVPAGSPAGSPQAVLQTNSEASGGLLPSDLTFTDSNAAPGDVYTFFVTDSEGNVGALSNTFTNVAAPPATLAPPAAGELAGVFTP